MQIPRSLLRRKSIAEIALNPRVNAIHVEITLSFYLVHLILLYLCESVYSINTVYTRCTLQLYM